MFSIKKLDELGKGSYVITYKDEFTYAVVGSKYQGELSANILCKGVAVRMRDAFNWYLASRHCNRGWFSIGERSMKNVGAPQGISEMIVDGVINVLTFCSPDDIPQPSIPIYLAYGQNNKSVLYTLVLLMDEGKPIGIMNKSGYVVPYKEGLIQVFGSNKELGASS